LIVSEKAASQEPLFKFQSVKQFKNSYIKQGLTGLNFHKNRGKVNSVKLKNFPKIERPREKLIAKGAQNLKDV